MKLKDVSLLTLCLAVCISVGFARAPKKIVNGNDAWRGQFPHQVSLQMWDQHFCGGSILDATHILTAAHCVVSREFKVKRREDVTVITGVNDHLDRNNDNVFAVSQIISHHSFTYKPDVKYDIAILKLARPISFNVHRKPINLPSKDTPSGLYVKASGWGAKVYGQKPTRYLQQLDMRALSVNECKRILGDRMGAGEICVESAAGTGACIGDSGGPLTSSNNEVIGIASWVSSLRSGKTCATGFPDVYTRVHYYLPWIQKVMSTR